MYYIAIAMYYLCQVIKNEACNSSDSVKLSSEFPALSNISLLLFGTIQEALIVLVLPAHHHHGVQA